MGHELCLAGRGASLPIYFIPFLIFTSSADPILHESFLPFYWYHFCKTTPPGNSS